MIANPPSRVGVGVAVAHHGELLQGAFRDGGTIVRALVTLPCHLAQAEARFVAGEESEVIVEPAGKAKAARAAELTLRYLGAKHRGQLTLAGEIPQGLGLGSSTADVVAAIRAVADGLGRPLHPELVGRLSVAAEKASDSIMFDCPVLFAHREGRLIEDFDAPLPPLTVLSVTSGPGVDTLEHPPAHYSEMELRHFDELRDQLRVALLRGDAAKLADVSTASVRINQRHLPLPGYEELERIGDETGALGVQASHSGAVLGLIFDPQTADVDRRLREARRALMDSDQIAGPTFTTTTERSYRKEAA
jgi:uncharacterized protein involved in propanediol utilization